MTMKSKRHSKKRAHRHIDLAPGLLHRVATEYGNRRRSVAAGIRREHFDC